MSELVVDASVVVRLLTATEPLPVEPTIERADLIAPAHLDAEVLSALARMHRAGLLTGYQVDQALTDLDALPVQRLPITHVQLMSAWALRHNVSAKDALYLALAEHRGTKVVTNDQRLRRAAPHLTLGPEDAEEG